RVGRAVEYIRVCVVVDELLDIEPGTSSSESKQPAGEKATASTDSSETMSAVTDPPPKKKKKSSASQPLSKSMRDAVGSTGKTGTTTARTAQSDATESTKAANEPKVAADPAPTANLSVARTASAGGAGVRRPARS